MYLYIYVYTVYIYVICVCSLCMSPAPAIQPSLPLCPFGSSFQVTFCHIRQEVGAEGDVKVSSFPGIRDPLGFQE